MANHLLIETHNNFRSASRSASLLASISEVATIVRRAGFSWGVFGDESHQAVINEARLEALDDEQWREPEISNEAWIEREWDRYVEHERSLLREGPSFALADYERSVEHGWMYED